MTKPIDSNPSAPVLLDSLPDPLLGTLPGVMTDNKPERKTVGNSSLFSPNSSDQATLRQSDHPLSGHPLPKPDELTGYGAVHGNLPVSTPPSRELTSGGLVPVPPSPEQTQPVVQSGPVNLVQSSSLAKPGKGVQRYIIQFDGSVGNISGRAKQIIRQHKGQLNHVYQNSFRGFAAVLPKKAIQALKKQAAITAIYEDVQVHLAQPKSRPQSKGITTTNTTTQSTQSTPWGVTHIGGAKDGTGKTAWVIDTGVDYTHPDLRVDTRRAKSFVSSRANDDNGHGTHVAGTIAALNNSTGVVGVAAGATIVPVKVLNKSGSGYLSDVIAGVDYVAKTAKAGDVANMSLGGGYYQPLNDAVLSAAAKGIKFAIAAGNESQDVATKSPASTNGVNVFTVSAIDSSNNLASFSNYGAGIDYAAPGVGIASTWMGGTYKTISGTSMATPHVAGLLLLGTPGINGVVQNDRDIYAEGVAFGVVA
jgi:subtilisin family serine protease